MTHYELHRFSTDRHSGTDVFRAAVLTFAAILAALVITAAVPEQVWMELTSAPSYDLPEWHGNVASHAPYH